MPKRFICSAAAVAALLFAHSALAAVTWDFDTTSDNGLDADGWTDTRGVSTNTSGGLIPIGGRTAAFDGTSDPAHNLGHTSLVFSSPLLNIVGPGNLKVDLIGGQGYGDSQIPLASLPANLSDIPTSAVSNANNVMLLALRRASDNAYVFHYQRPTNSGDWVTYNVDLSAFAGNGVGYYLDLIDSRSGNWGHLSIDDVTIDAVVVPEPTAAALLVSAAVGLYFFRPRNASKVG